MFIPIRCFTCGALIADKHSVYVERVNSGEAPRKILDSMGIKKYCCRRMLLSNSDTIDQVLPYFEALANRKAELGKG